MKTGTILSSLAAEHWNIPLGEISCQPFNKGASGRFLCRLSSRKGSVVGVAWDREREDNSAFISAARHLAGAGVAVPLIFQYMELKNKQGEEQGGLALIEDMGDTDLLSLANTPWEERKPLYVKALQELRKLHLSHSHERIQPPFDEHLYLWEQEYFAEHFLGTHLGWQDWKSFLSLPDLRSMAEKLATLPRLPIHRDFQSQNIMIRDSATYLIDFQGMRMGLPEYDVASLVYDPYARLAEAEKEELWREWMEICDHESNEETYRLCICQRLMQALGAFANIGHNQGKTWYFDQIPPAISNLSSVLSITELAKPLRLRLVE